LQLTDWLSDCNLIEMLRVRFSAVTGGTSLAGARNRLSGSSLQSVPPSGSHEGPTGYVGIGTEYWIK